MEPAGDHVDHRHRQAPARRPRPARAAARQSRLRWTYSSSPRAAAAAWATASETPSTALAPSRPLFGVPSSAISAASSAAWSSRSIPTTAGAISSWTLRDRPAHPLAAVPAVVACRAARAPRAGPCSPPTGRSPGPPPRSTPSPRPPPSAGPASRAPRGPSASSRVGTGSPLLDLDPSGRTGRTVSRRQSSRMPISVRYGSIGISRAEGVTSSCQRGGRGAQDRQGERRAAARRGRRRGNRRGSCRRPGPACRPPCARRRAEIAVGVGAGERRRRPRRPVRRRGTRGSGRRAAGSGRRRRPRRRPARNALSSRWLRKNPRSNAGSPACAVSKSTRVSPCEWTRMFFGLKSARTRQRRVGACHRGDQGVDLRRELGVDPGDRPVERVDPQLVEDRRVGEPAARGRGGRGSRRGSVAEQLARAAGDGRVGLPGEELLLPDDRVVRGAGHREQVVLLVGEEDAGDGPLGRARSPSSSSAARSVQIRSSRLTQ